MKLTNRTSLKTIQAQKLRKATNPNFGFSSLSDKPFVFILYGTMSSLLLVADTTTTTTKMTTDAKGKCHDTINEGKLISLH